MSETIPETQHTLINDQYLTIQMVGKGGFGAVWKAYDFSLRNFVAIKELLREYNQMKYIEMFYKEALISRNIVHDNIVRVQHFWKADNGSYFIMMDYVGGADLEHLVKKRAAAGKSVPWELCVLITSSVLKALDYANRQAKDPITGVPYGIVYRDISPGNIIISFEGSVKLSDFGIAKTADELNGGLKQRVVTGKYAYMSPEQIRGAADIDHRSDIFSVGVVLYEMLAGTPLFKGSPEEIKEKVISERFDPASLAALRLPEALIDVLAKALSKDREKRYEKAIEMFRDLRRLLRGRETEELTDDLASFIRVSLPDELARENESTNWVKQLTLQEIKDENSVLKIRCRDFIVGDIQDPAADETEGTAPAAPRDPNKTIEETIPLENSTPAKEPGKPVVPEKRDNEAAPVPETGPAADPGAIKPEPSGIESPLPSESEKAVKPPSVQEPPASAPPPPVQQPPAFVPPKLIHEPAAPLPPPIEKKAPEPMAQKPAAPPPPPPPPHHPPAIRKPAPLPSRFAEPRASMHVPEEEKGKTVFEEVGDWLVTKFRAYRARVIRIGIGLAVSAVAFFLIDVYTQITPMGKNIYSRLYPPDIVITTVPSGALVSMRTRDGKDILSNVDSINPIDLRKIPASTYVITATKEGFKTLERVIRIEDQPKGSQKQQRIVLSFDFTMSIDSEPPGAEIYIDGNKFKTTPWKGELVSGEHTIRLTRDGFEELGSLAKEAKDGQCNIDFTRPTIPEMFTGVDTRYWSFQMKNTGGESVFALVGNLYKNVSIKSVPTGMLVHLENESQSRGKTPMVVPLKCGDYRIRFMDPEGKYQETAHALKVNAESSTEVNARLNRFVVFKVRARENPEEAFITSVKVVGENTFLTREISPSRPVRLALPVGTYRIQFMGGNGFKPITYANVNISDKSLFVGDLEYEDPHLKVVVREAQTERPVPDATIWYQDKAIGQSNSSGEWAGNVERGPGTVRIVAKGYVEKSYERKLLPGKREELNAALALEVVISTSAPVYTPYRPILPDPEPKKEPRPDPVIVTKPAEQTIICPFCKKEYNLPPGKRLRFCTNCGKSFR